MRLHATKCKTWLFIGFLLLLPCAALQKKCSNAVAIEFTLDYS